MSYRRCHAHGAGDDTWHMPFGLYKGRPLSDLPLCYLEWVATIARDPLRAYVHREIFRREGAEPTGDERRQEVRLDCATAQAIIDAGRRTLALRFHPDRPGGDLARMQAVNAAADRMLADLDAARSSRLWRPA